MMTRVVWTGMFACLTVIFFISGCASQKPLIAPVQQPPAVGGFYHKVAVGETLWSIAKSYNVDLSQIVSVNRIPNASQIEKDQLIFIPKTQTSVSTAAPTISFAKSERFAWPVRGEIISYFGSVTDNRINKGITIKVASITEVQAPRPGVVSYVGEVRGYGKTVIIDHRDGLMSVCSGLQTVLVVPHDTVTQGQALARIEDPSAPLHFEVRNNKRPQNPLYYLP